MEDDKSVQITLPQSQAIRLALIVRNLLAENHALSASHRAVQGELVQSLTAVDQSLAALREDRKRLNELARAIEGGRIQNLLKPG